LRWEKKKERNVLQAIRSDSVIQKYEKKKSHMAPKKRKINKGKTGADRRPLTMGGGSWYHAFATQGSDKGKARYLTRRYAKGVV